MPFFIYLISLGLSLLYFLLKRRNLDFFSVFFFSNLFYSFPALLREVKWTTTYGGYYSEIPDDAYFSLFLINGLIVLFAYVFDYYVQDNMLDFDTDFKAVDSGVLYSIILISYAAIAIELYQNKSILGGMNKQEWVQGKTLFYNIFIISAIFANVISIINKRLLPWGFSILLIFLSIYAGEREVLIFTMIPAFVYLNRKKKIRLIRKWYYALLFISLLYVALILKGISQGLRANDLQLILSNMNRFDTIELLIMKSEPVIIFSQFIEVINADLHFDFSYFVEQLQPIVPMANYVFDPASNFNDFVQEPLFGIRRNQFGMAYSSLGEWYGLGGIFGIIYFTSIICSLVYAAQWFMKNNKNTLIQVVMLILLSFLTFFCFRNGITQILDWIRRILLFGGFAYLIHIFLVTIANIVSWYSHENPSSR
jgi:oligosaccharide repeat unit polymerase